MTEEHFPFVREAIALSKSAVEHGNEPFGAVLVKNGEIILRAENSIYTLHDPTNHAETNLVRLAVAKYEADFLKDCTLYTSTEPCVMCAGAIYWSNIGRMVYACSEKRLAQITGGGGFDLPCEEVFAHGLGHQVEVIGPILEEEAAPIHLAYWKR
ncbi:MAG: nucleoside deaminase [Anaerolineae bacterium]|nr:nucleoside deaminase [Anaerolineae bacterium]